MDAVLVLLMISVTSAAACVVGRSLLDLDWARLRHAARQMLTCFGLAAVFTLANLVVGVGLIALVKATTRAYMSAYVMSDITLLIVSVTQAILFFQWGQPTVAARSGPTLGLTGTLLSDDPINEGE